MDLLQLKYFQTVARLQHMTNAANELQIAQPALSITIARLEEDLGVPLFNRTGRNIILNEYGRAFLKRVNKILIELEAGRQEILDMSGDYLGYVSFTSTSLNKQFSNLIGSFVHIYPKANFRITQISDDKFKLQLLEADEIDFAFINTSIERPGIVKLPLIEEDIFLAVSPNHHLANQGTVSFQELASEPFISLKNNDSLQEFYEKLYQKNGFTRNIICECSESVSLINLVAAGIGISFFPYSDDTKKDLPVVLLKIEGINCKSVLQLAWKRKRYFSKIALHFREYVTQYFK